MSEIMKTRLAKTLFLLAVALGTLWAYLRIHTYATGQDPRTFLLIAKGMLGGASPVDARLVVPGWPLALAGVTKLFGVHAAFWTNVPLFVLLVWALQALLEEVTGRFGRSALVAAASALLLLGAYALNPHFLLWVFRQTPVYLTGVLGMLCIVRALRREAEGRRRAALGWLFGAWAATAAGVLVRETGVLMVPAMALCLLAFALGWAGPVLPAGTSPRRRWFLFWVFAGTGIAGAVAVLLGAWLLGLSLATRQSGYLMQLLPGVVGRSFRASPAWTMLVHLPVAFGRIGTACLAVGVAGAFRRPRREFLFCFLLPALAYWAFDGLNNKFHWRFFLSTLVFLAPLAVTGACSLAEWLWAALWRLPALARRPALRTLRRPAVVWTAVWLAMAAWTAHTVSALVPWGVRASRADVARALEVLGPCTAPGRPLLLDWRTRCLSDVLEVFTDWSMETVDAARAASYLRDPPLVFAQPLNDAALYRYGAVFGPPAESVLREQGRLEPIPGSDFSLGDARFRAVRLLPWTDRVAKVVLPPPPESALLPPPPSVFLRLAVPAAAAAGNVRASLLGRPLGGPLQPGYNFLAVPRDLAGTLLAEGGGELALEADVPIPGDFSADWIPPGMPLVMEFGFGRNPSCEAWLSEEFRAFAHLRNPVRDYPYWRVTSQATEFAGDGSIRLPAVPADADAEPAVYRVSLVMRPVHGDPDGSLAVTVSLPEFPDVPPATVRHPHVQIPQAFEYVFGPLPAAPTELRLHSEHEVVFPPRIRANPRHRNVLLTSLSVRAVGPADSISLPVGRPWDRVILGDGFHNRENAHSANHGRWTAARAEIALPLRPGRSYRLELDFDELRPAAAPPAAPRLELNGKPLAAVPTETGLAAEVDASLLEETNRLCILADTWSPRDFGAGDTRDLGIYLRSFRATPCGPDAPREL